jgi:hypothetical protein
MPLSNIKFTISKTLFEKICLIKCLFRKYNLPNEMYEHVMNPLFKSDLNTVMIFSKNDKRFVSMFEYAYDFSVILSEKWATIFNPKLMGYISRDAFKTEFTKDEFIWTVTDENLKSKYMMLDIGFINYFDDFILISYEKRIKNIPIYTLFTFTNDDIYIHACYTKFWECCYDVNENDLAVIVDNDIKRLYWGLLSSNFKGFNERITKKHIEQLQRKIEI